MANFLEVFEDVTKLGTKIPTDEYLDSGEYPIIDQGQAYIQVTEMIEQDFSQMFLLLSLVITQGF